MKPPDTPVASVIISELHAELRDKGLAAPCLMLSGRGILAPGVVIPNEWWDRPQLVTNMELVGPPQVTAEHVLAVDFRARCLAEHVSALHAVFMAGPREQIEREIVPALLIAIGIGRSKAVAQAKPLPPVTRPFGMPVDWAEPAACAVLQGAVEAGMLASDKVAALLSAPAEPAVAVRTRSPRIRVVDT
jgi:hypothetical protein